MFQNTPLKEFVVPKNVAAIGTGAFVDVPLETLILKPTTPPTLQATGVFSGFRPDFAIYCLDVYETATNWTAYADYMQEVGNGGSEYAEVLIEGTEHMELTTGEWEDVPYASVSEEISIDQTTGEITLTGSTLQSNVSLYDYLPRNSVDLDGGYSFEYHGSDIYLDLSDCNVILDDGYPQVSNIIKLRNGGLWSWDLALSVYIESLAYDWVTAEKGV